MSDEVRKHETCNVVVPTLCYWICLGLPTARAHLSHLCDALPVGVLFNVCRATLSLSSSDLCVDVQMDIREYIGVHR